MCKTEFIKKIPALEKVFIISSDFTKGPFVYCDKESFDDTAIICLNENIANTVCNDLEEEHNKVRSLEVSNKELLFALSGMYLYGINAVDFVGEDFKHNYQLTEIISIADRSGMENKPIENPILQLVMLYFIQELKKGEEYADKENIRAHQEELIENLKKSRFILPYKEMLINDEKRTQLALIGRNEKTYLPLFTDLMEFNRFNKTEDIKIMAMDFKDILKLDISKDIDAFVINPAGVEVNIVKQLIDILKEG